VDVITFSGDKLLGGPQAGVILGKSKYIRKIHANPIYRAVRCDKTTIALMEETLRTFLSDGFNQNNLTNSLLQTSQEILKSRGQQIVRKISPQSISSLKIELVSSSVEVGSGSLPNVDVESIALRFNPAHIKAAKLAELFRSGEIPVVGYIKGNNFYIDLKAIPENQFQDLITAINRIQ
jgi:L-seryl-tRNA(Ser) seleniumtransferase